METIYLYDRQTYVLGLAFIAVLTVLLIVAFCQVIVVSIVHGEWRNMGTFLRILRYIIPGTMLLVFLLGLMVAEVNLAARLYEWDHKKYQIVEGNLFQINIQDDTRRGDIETMYKCDFVINGLHFPKGANRYTEETIQSLSNADIVRVYYLLDGGEPWPWRIDIIKSDDDLAS